MYFNLGRCISVWASTSGTIVIWMHGGYKIVQECEYNSTLRDNTLMFLGMHAYDFIKYLEKIRENGLQ